MEAGEDIREAAFRELHEEAGLAREDIELGPVVWRSEVHMVLAGTPSHIKDQYIVEKLRRNNGKISNENFTDWEKEVVRKVDWFSLEQIKNISDPVYPIGLVDYLPDILEEKYPNFSYHVALSDPMPEDKWEGMTGYIHQQLHDAYLFGHNDPTEIEYYICGPPMMVQAVEDMLDNQGVDPEMIAYDKFS